MKWRSTFLNKIADTACAFSPTQIQRSSILNWPSSRAVTLTDGLLLFTTKELTRHDFIWFERVKSPIHVRFLFVEIWGTLELSVIDVSVSSTFPTHIRCHLPALTALSPLLVLFPSISLPFFHHSLVLFDLFTRVQMSQQRERSGKGLVFSKVSMASTVLAAWGGSTLTLEPLNTHLHTHARTHPDTLLSPPLHVDATQLRAGSHVICVHVTVRVCLCVLIWFICEHGWLKTLQLPRDDTWPCWTQGQRSLVVRGLQHPAFKGQCRVFNEGPACL